MKNQIKTIVLLGALSALLIGVGGALGPQYLWVFTALALGMNLFAYFFSDRLVLRLYRARELSPTEAPALHAMVEDLAAAAAIPKPRIHLIQAEHANAFATGRNPNHASVAVTSGLLSLLDQRELRGVLAHELSHVRNRDVLVATVAAVPVAPVTHEPRGRVIGARHRCPLTTTAWFFARSSRRRRKRSATAPLHGGQRCPCACVVQPDFSGSGTGAPMISPTEATAKSTT